MKKKIYFTKIVALSLSVIVAFSACHNSRFDKDNNEKTSFIEETTNDKSTEKESETKDNDKKLMSIKFNLHLSDHFYYVQTGAACCGH